MKLRGVPNREIKICWIAKTIILLTLTLTSFSAIADNNNRTLRIDLSRLERASSVRANGNGTFERTVTANSPSVAHHLSHMNLKGALSVDRIPFSDSQKRRDLQGRECCTSGITGKVLLGPACPVVTVPPSPNCEDKPYQAEIVVESGSQKRGQGSAAQEVARFSSNSKGEFRIPLPPGTYLLKSANTNAATFPFASPQVVKVEPDKFATITIRFDTGIR
jgi:hypothetical protein